MQLIKGTKEKSRRTRSKTLPGLDDEDSSIVTSSVMLSPEAGDLAVNERTLFSNQTEQSVKPKAIDVASLEAAVLQTAPSNRAKLSQDSDKRTPIPLHKSESSKSLQNALASLLTPSSITSATKDDSAKTQAQAGRGRGIMRTLSLGGSQQPSPVSAGKPLPLSGIAFYIHCEIVNIPTSLA